MSRCRDGCVEATVSRTTPLSIARGQGRHDLAKFLASFCNPSWVVGLEGIEILLLRLCFLEPWEEVACDYLGEGVRVVVFIKNLGRAFDSFHSRRRHEFRICGALCERG